MKLLAKDQSARTELHCDGKHHIQVTLPQDVYSGFPCDLTLTDCDCDAKAIFSDTNDTGNDGTPDLSNAAVESAPATPAEFEKL
jgi:hypothetical protein